MFLQPVDVEAVPDYTDIVKKPCDLSLIRCVSVLGAATMSRVCLCNVVPRSFQAVDVEALSDYTDVVKK